MTANQTMTIRCRRKRSRLRGLITAEALTSITIIGLMAGILLQFTVSYLRARNNLLTERTLLLAAQAQLTRYQAGVPLNEPALAGTLPPHVQIQTVTTPGGEQWAGFTKVTVTASTTERDRPPVTLSCFIPLENQP